jgi:hypothetical protein
MEPPLFPIVFWCPETGLIGVVSLFKSRRIKHLIVAAITELVVRRALPFDERISKEGLSHGGRGPESFSLQRRVCEPSVPTELSYHYPRDPVPGIPRRHRRFKGDGNTVRLSPGLFQPSRRTTLLLSSPRWRSRRRETASSRSPARYLGAQPAQFVVEVHECRGLRRKRASNPRWLLRGNPRPYRGEWPIMLWGPMVRIPLPVARPVELDAGLANRGNSRTEDRELFPARTNPGVCETQIRAAHAVPGWRARPRNPRCR